MTFVTPWWPVENGPHVSPVSCTFRANRVFSHLLSAEPVIVGNSLVEPPDVQVFVVLFYRDCPFPEFWSFLVPQRQTLERILHLVYGIGIGDGRVPATKFQDLCVASLMLGLLGMVDLDEGSQGLLPQNCQLQALRLVMRMPTRNRSDRSPFLDHLSQSWMACFQFPVATAS